MQLWHTESLSNFNKRANKKIHRTDTQITHHVEHYVLEYANILRKEVYGKCPRRLLKALL